MDQTITIGTLIHGTLRDEDLLPAFASELRRVGVLTNHVALLRSAYFENLTDHPEGAADIVNDLIDALNEYAPSHMYFGAIEGDGSDFGWWADIDSMDGCESRILDDHNAIDLDCQLHVNVNDHGNVTVSELRGKEIWSAV